MPEQMDQQAVIDMLIKHGEVDHDVDEKTVYIVSKTGRIYFDAGVIATTLTDHAVFLAEDYAKVRDDAKATEEEREIKHAVAESAAELTRGFVQFVNNIASLTPKVEPKEENLGLYL